jgi:pimeloyl-ACP methyl ester carboxylesterase
MAHSLFIILLGLILNSSNHPSNSLTKNNFTLITYQTEDGGTIEASFFDGGKDLAVIFAHGAVFNKESWYFMAEKLQSKGVSSLSLDFRGYGNSKTGTTTNKAFDILGAIDYLKKEGFENIVLVGGSMGGAAILNALQIKTNTSIKKVVLLAPAGGEAVSSSSIEKLFIVSKNEGLFSKVEMLFNSSTQPKTLKIYEGSFHAQHMFKSSYADEIARLIIDFITN